MEPVNLDQQIDCYDPCCWNLFVPHQVQYLVVFSLEFLNDNDATKKLKE